MCTPQKVIWSPRFDSFMSKNKRFRLNDNSIIQFSKGVSVYMLWFHTHIILVYLQYVCWILISLKWKIAKEKNIHIKTKKLRWQAIITAIIVKQLITLKIKSLCSAYFRPLDWKTICHLYAFVLSFRYCSILSVYHKFWYPNFNEKK